MLPLKKDIKKKLDDSTDNEKMLVLNYLVKELDRPDPEIDKARLKEISIRNIDKGKGIEIG
jgi:hypothetical protein